MNLVHVVPGLAAAALLLAVRLPTAMHRLAGSRPVPVPAIDGPDDDGGHWHAVALELEYRLREANRKRDEMLDLLVEAEREIGLMRAEIATRKRDRQTGPTDAITGRFH